MLHVARPLTPSCNALNLLFRSPRRIASRSPKFKGLQAHRTRATMISGEVFFLDEFASRQWDDPDYAGETTFAQMRCAPLFPFSFVFCPYSYLS